jgi:cytochrome oxidase Cu insertion factor (SCO1/SenC/PrrC family)
VKLGPRAKLALVAAIFAAPVAASLIVYHFFPPTEAVAYGELIAPTPMSSQPFRTPAGGEFGFAQLKGKWLLVTSDSGDCAEACVEKLTTLRQVRLALGRNADRVVRVLVIDDTRPVALGALAPFEGTQVAVTLPGMKLPTGAANDRAHIYVVDPRGLVMMRFPARPERGRMLKDLNRLLKASQIG